MKEYQLAHLQQAYREWEAANHDKVYWANRDPRSSSSVSEIDDALTALQTIVEDFVGVW